MRTLLRPLGFLLLAVAFFANRSAAQNAVDEMDKMMQEAAGKNLFNGTMVVMENGKLIYNKSYGYSNLEAKAKIDENTLYNMCSISKQFTAMGIMMLEEKGKLKYSDDITLYLPELPYKGITIQHLLTHTSGLPDYMILAFNEWPEGNTYANAEAIGLLAKFKSPVGFAPGERFQYSNTGYMLLASIIEKASGKSFSKFMADNIFAPLKMKRSFVYTPADNEKGKANIAVGYAFDRFKVENLPAENSVQFGKQVKTIIYTVGDGGIYSTAADMLKWYDALVKGSLVKPATQEKAFASAKLNDGKDAGYGYGWFIVNDPAYGKVIQHTGGWPGFRHALVYTVSKNRMLMVLRNTEIEFRGIQPAVNALLDGRPPVSPQCSLGQLLAFTAVGGASPAEIQEAYARYKKAALANETEINEIGYGLLGRGLPAQSLEVMKINAELFPKSWNVYDSLGELYLKNGDKPNAKLNYQKSLDLNPQNDGAKKALAQL